MPGIEGAEGTNHDERKARSLRFNRNPNNSGSSRISDTSVCIADLPVGRNNWGRSGKDQEGQLVPEAGEFFLRYSNPLLTGGCASRCAFLNYATKKGAGLG